ncbi:MarR family transcriptional regulator [Micromonospora sp. KC207]|uniref:winged helix-turn-helix domain-containing protein n=1 Tax=Micromonospora sp. KC207 TaxID=2530377 RepID=UPI00105022CB|nr:winged helix-turn-helix domain-containing protein [Micromonospora sp. KC207]TDC66903.1 MarR family transcriptional regulator [Micromonospora sp. KC207]
MDNEPEQNANPTALDKVTAALAALGQDTAAAIAQRAGVGYSTATKRLRVLEEAGQAETFRADDGRTLWRQPASTAGSIDTPATATDDPPHTLEPDRAPHGNPEQPGGTPAPAADTDTDTTVAAEPEEEESTGNPPDEVRRPAPQVAADPPAPPQDTSPPPGGGLSEARAPDLAGEGGEPVTTVSVEHSAAVEAGEVKPGRDLDPASAHDHLPAGGQAEAPDTAAGAQARRSKGSLRGAIRDVLEAHPDQPFKTSQLCKAIDEANEGSGSAKASAGAVVNAVHKLVAVGIAVQVADRPATFQLAPTSD